MKRLVCAVIAVVMTLCLFTGCTKIGNTEKAPSEIKNTKWVTYDCKFSFKTNDNCKGFFAFDKTEFDVAVSFDNDYVTVTDINKDKVLWDGQWKYEEDNKVYIYNVSYNTKDYPELETDYMEFYTLKMEKIK